MKEGSFLPTFLCILGLVTQFPPDMFSFLSEMQNKLAKVIKSVGKIDHELYPFLIICYLTSTLFYS